MSEKTMSVEDELVEDERFEEMLELEYELVEEKFEQDGDSSTDESEEPVRSASGVVRSVRESGDRVIIELFVDGDVVTDSVNRPDDVTDPDEELNRLCQLCGVERGRVSRLQGESVPIVWNEKFSCYELHLPSKTGKLGLMVYRLWWWIRRRGVNPSRLKSGFTYGSIFSLYCVGLYTLYMVLFVLPGDVTEKQEKAHDFSRGMNPSLRYTNHARWRAESPPLPRALL